MDLKDKILELQKTKEKLVAIAVKSEKMYKEGINKIAKAKDRAKEIAKNPIPDWAKDMMLKAGIDPEEPHVELTREKVIELYANGKSFAMKNLSELDLSNLDLNGIDYKFYKSQP